MKKNRELLIAFFLIFVVSLFLHRAHLNEFPRFIHAWTQSDRYALSLGFLDNGFDFFHPTSFNLRPDPTVKPNVETGITPVDPPIPEYIVAISMKLTGTREPAVFRIYQILISCLGLTALYALLKDKGVSKLWRIAVIAFVFLSPVYFYYKSGFIPSVSALSFVMIGVYIYYSPEWRSRRSLAFIFLCMAALTRSPFLLPLGILGLFYFIKERKWMAFTMSLAVFVLFMLWNNHLTEQYGSMFLRKLMHAENLEEFQEYFRVAWNSWIYSYFTEWHYIFAILVISGSIYLNRKNGTRTFSGMRQFAFLWLLASAVYYVAMQAQFMAHDYYFLDSFFLPFVLLFVSYIPEFDHLTRQYKVASLTGAVIFIILAGYSNGTLQKKRRVTGSWDRTDITYNNFTGAEKLMDELKIEPSAKMLVIDGYTINTPLILLNRKGYSILNTRKETLEDALTWDYDYVVIQDEFLLSDIIKPYPDIQNKLVKVGGNGKISVYKRLRRSGVSFATFFGLQAPDREFRSDSCVVGNSEFGCTVDLPVELLLNNDPTYVLFQANTVTDDLPGDLNIVCEASNNEGQLFRRAFAIRDYITADNKPSNLHFMFVIPKLEAQSFKLYLWNPGSDDRLVLRNVSVRLYHR